MEDTTPTEKSIDPRLPEPFRALLAGWEHSLPPMAGGSPEGEGDGGDQGDGGSAPAPEGGDGEGAAEGTGAGDAGGSGEGTSDGDQGFTAPFDINEVPEGVREHVERYAKQLQGEFTRKTQALPPKKVLDLVGRLQGDHALDALNELAAELGYEPTDGGGEGEGDEGAAGEEPESTGNEALDEARAEIRQLRERLDSRDTAEATEARREHILDGLDDYANELGVEDLPEQVTRQIMVNALGMPEKDGKPDMEGAIQAWKDAEQAAIEAYVASKDVDPLDTSGSSGVGKHDLTTPEGRLKAANAVAERTHASHQAN